MSLFRTLAAVLLAAATLPLHAQTASPAPSQGTEAMPVYAMLSLIGDKLEIVIKQSQAGSNLNQNRRQPVPIDNPIFDSTAASAAGNAIKRVQPHAELAILNARSPVLFDRQQTLFESRGDKLAVPEAIVEAAKKQGANRLVLVLKRRDEANLMLRNWGDSFETGKLEGLGFYLDSTTNTATIHSETGQRTVSGIGFIAPFVYVDVMVLDTASLKVLGRRAITAASIATAGRAGQDIGEPWNALSSADKVRYVSQLIEREVTKVTLELITALK
ncbi:MAG: hypothetical protein JNK75_12605 [Betaproteobacteria bacterium]|nr:hypothetical protein [Betaproteobacteria bacterium]